MRNLFLFSMITLLLSACGKPIADFTYATKQEAAPAEVQFDNQSKDAESYHWDFGDGNISTAASPAHVYTSSGNFAIKLTAMKGNKSTTTEKKIKVEQPLDCLVVIETEFGDMTVRLSNATPHHRDNFIKLTEEGFFDGLLFHRVIDGFMIQGGDPASKGAAAGVPLGMGGPGYTVQAEFVDSLVHVKGALSAARQGDQVNPEKASSGSQFYVVQGKPLTDAEIDRIENSKGIRYTPEQREVYKTLGGTPFLDRDYTVFGHVIKGLDVIDKIAKVEKDPRDRPTTDVKMKVKVIK